MTDHDSGNSGDSLIAAQSLICHLPPDASLDAALLTNAEIVLPDSIAPHAPINHLETLLRQSKQIKGISPVVFPTYVPLFVHHIVERHVDVYLVFDNHFVEFLWANHPQMMNRVLDTENGLLWVRDHHPPIGFVLTNDDVVWVAIYDEDGGLLVQSSTIATLRSDGPQVCFSPLDKTPNKFAHANPLLNRLLKTTTHRQTSIEWINAGRLQSPD